MNVAPGGRRSLRRRQRVVLVASAATSVLALDQVTKAIAVDRLANGPVQLIGPFRLELAFNSGIAFSLFSGLTLPIVLVVLALLAVLTRFARTVATRPAAVAVGMVLGGALGNLADRLLRAHGQVVDFVYSGFWPTFNLADAAVVIGAAILSVSIWRSGARTRHGQPERAGGAAPAPGERHAG